MNIAARAPSTSMTTAMLGTYKAISNEDINHTIEIIHLLIKS